MIMTKQEIENRIEQLEKTKRDAQRDIDAKLNVKVAQIMVDSCNKEIKELQAKV